jgi:SAM-dependent methyltransferase
MAKYHRYVFDNEARRLVGDFETMYAAEDKEGFDSWQSHDTRHLRLHIARAILADYNFDNVLEIGCGKGTAAQFLKRRNNRVLGIDIAPTAIAKAQASFPDIEFRCMDANDIGTLGERFDLVSVQGTFAYVSGWRDLLATIAGMTDFCLIAEYIPPNPIGMVKSAAELLSAFSGHFTLAHRVILDDEIVILLGRSKSAR